MSFPAGGAGVLRAYLDAGDRRSYGEFDALLHPDVVEHNPGGATATGIDAQVTGWEAAHAGLRGLRHEVVEFLGEGDLVAARVVVSATHAGPFLGVAATGRRLRIDQAVFARLRDGRIAELWHIVDTGHGLRQLGVLGEQPLSP